VIYTFSLYGRGFTTESVVLIGSTITSDPMEKVVPHTFISSGELEVTIDTSEFENALMHVSVLQTPFGLRSATVTLNPRLRPNIPAIAVDNALHAVISERTDFYPIGVKATITSNDPSPVKASASKPILVDFLGTDFVNGCQFQMTGPSGAQSGVCTWVSALRVRANLNVAVSGSHQMVVINPAPGVASNPYAFQVSP
jgi:hypothetical protein